MTLRTLNYGNYGIFLTMGNAGFCPSTVVPPQSYKLPFLLKRSLIEPALIVPDNITYSTAGN